MADTKAENPDPGLTQPDTGQLRGPGYQQLNYDKLASDRIGEELNPNATIWKLYVDEANGYDAELASERNENLNNMLLFATLFSAIVTAFIIESTNLLEQDSSDVSSQLLLILVQSQQRIEAGAPNSMSPPVQIPEFIPSVTARVINVLWFASLIISLGAAVVAILAKEWLTAYTTNRTRDAHKYALERHDRLVSLDTWKMLLVIDLLPTFLNFSLFVFGLGLIIRLWLLDSIVAGVMTALSATVCLIYLFFMISGAVYDSSPYKSRLSAYIRTIEHGVIKRFTSRESADSHTQNNPELNTDKIIKPKQAALLTWLFNHASDPIMGSYVTQALAGLKSLKIKLPTFLNGGQSDIEDKYMQNREILTSMFELGAQAVAQLQTATSRGRNELELCGGANAARLATAIAEIFPHALSWQLCLPAETAQAREDTFKEQGRDEIPEPATQNNGLAIDMISVCKITDNVFGALDQLWVETSPALTLSSYAYLLAAELKMIRYALAFLRQRATEPVAGIGHDTIEMNIPSADAQPHILRSNLGDIPRRYCTGLAQIALMIKNSSLRAFAYVLKLVGPHGAIKPAGQGGNPEGTENTVEEHPPQPDLNEDALRGRYGYTLTITALVIKASLSHVTSKGSKELQSAITALLCETTELVEQEKPKPDNSSHRFGVKDYIDFDRATFFYAAESNTTRSVTCQIYETGYELMEGLVKLCESSTDTMRSTSLREGFRVAAFNLILTFWPAYIEQRRRDWAADCNVPAWVYQHWRTVPVESTPYNSQTSADIIVYQSTVLAHIAFQIETWKDLYDKVLPYWERQGWSNIRQVIFKLLISRYRELPKLTEALGNHPNIQGNLYCKWFPAANILVDWISSLYDQCPTSLFPPDQGLEASQRLCWWIGYAIVMMKDLPDCQVEGHSHGDVLTHLIPPNPSTQDSDTTIHLQPVIAQFMNFIYGASHAADRDDSIPVIDMLVEEFSKHIETAASGQRLEYFTQGQGFELLLKLVQTEADQTKAIYMVWKVVIGLNKAQLCISTEVLPSLLRVFCYIFDVDMATNTELLEGMVSRQKQMFKSDRPDYIFERKTYFYLYLNDFIAGVRFQLEQLLKPIHPAVLFLVQNTLCHWASSARRVKDQDRSLSLISTRITAFRDQVQKWVELGTSAGTSPRNNDCEPSASTTSSIPASPLRLPTDSSSRDKSSEVSLSDQIIPTWLFPGNAETEDSIESIRTDGDDRPVDQ